MTSPAYTLIKAARHYGIKIIPDLPRPSTQHAKHRFKNNPIVVAEVGVREGKNALNILKVLNVKELYLFDVDFSKTDKHLNNDYDKRIWRIKGESKNTLRRLPPCDYVYIDGSHLYNDVMQDLELAYKAVKPGGILGGHDINIKGNDVVEAVQNFIRKYNIKAYNIFFDDNDFTLIK